MCCKLIWLILVLLQLRLFASSSEILDASSRTEALILPEIQDWRCHTGDDLRWARPDWNDHDWAPCSPASWSTLGVSWRRLRVRLPSNDVGTPWSVGTVLPPASVLYANGDEIASSGRIGASPLYLTPAYRILPLPSLGNYGGTEVVFAMRLQHSPLTRTIIIVRFITPGLVVVGPELGRRSLIEQREQLYIFRRLTTAVPYGVVGLLALLLGAYVLRLWSAEPSHLEYAWFVAIAVLFNFRAVLQFIAIGFATHAEWFQALDNGSAADLLLPPFFWTLFRHHVPRWIAIYTTLIIAIRFLGTLWVPDLNAMPWIWLGTVPCYLLPAGITLKEAWRGESEARVLAPSMLFYGTLGVWINLWLASISTGPVIVYVSTSLPSLHFGMVTVSAIHIGEIVFLLTTAVVLADRARRTGLEQARLAGEMFAARQVQQLLVPASKMAVGHYRIESAYLPFEQVGGDFFEFVPSSDGGLLVIVGDVSGKGLKAAMLVSLVIGAVERIRRETQQPAAVLNFLNEVLCAHVESGFVTCCCARMESTGEIRIANAGHLPPYCNGEEFGVEGGLPLGVMPNGEWPESARTLAAGDRVVFLSDGVPEARDRGGILLGFERTRSLLRQPLTVHEIAATARDFGQQDDITVIEILRMNHQVQGSVPTVMG